jgi:hypothetical protein
MPKTYTFHQQLRHITATVFSAEVKLGKVLKDVIAILHRRKGSNPLKDAELIFLMKAAHALRERVKMERAFRMANKAVVKYEALLAKERKLDEKIKRREARG